MNGVGEDRNHWSQVAEEWVVWARKPNHDAFWAYRASLAAFIGCGNGKALDVGCGEGRISRELTACGFQVTAVDPVSRLVRAAIEAQSARNYTVASELPFDNAQFDLVVAYNVLMDVEDVPTALKEFRRVLHPKGQLIISICHPFVDHGRFASKEMSSPFVVEGTYFGRQRFEGAEERNGLRMHLPAGANLSKPTGSRWRKRDSRSHHFANLSLTWVKDGTTWRLGFACRRSFG